MLTAGIIFLLYMFFLALLFDRNPENKKVGKTGLIVLSSILLTPVVIVVLFFLTCIGFMGLK